MSQDILDKVSLVVGFGLSGCATIGLWYNEKRWTSQIKDVKGPCKNAIEVKNPNSNSTNKMIITSGLLKPASRIQSPFIYDSESLNKYLEDYLWIKETVEFCQWEEEIVNNESFPKQYKYKRVWKEERIASENFRGNIEVNRNNPLIPLNLKSWRRSPQDGYNMNNFDLPRTVLYNPLNPYQDHLSKLNLHVDEIIPKQLSYRIQQDAQNGNEDEKKSNKSSNKNDKNDIIIGYYNKDDGYFYFRMNPIESNKKDLNNSKEELISYQVGDFRVKITGVPKQIVTVLGYHQEPNVIKPLPLLHTIRLPNNNKNIRARGLSVSMDDLSEIADITMGRTPKSLKTEREITEIFAFEPGYLSKRYMIDSLIEPITVPRRQFRVLGIIIMTISMNILLISNRIYNRFYHIFEKYQFLNHILTQYQKFINPNNLKWKNRIMMATLCGLTVSSLAIMDGNLYVQMKYRLTGGNPNLYGNMNIHNNNNNISGNNGRLNQIREEAGSDGDSVIGNGVQE